MVNLSAERKRALDALSSKAARIRALKAEGFMQAEIARHLGLSDQHVSNVLRRSAQAGIAAERLPPETPAATPAETAAAARDGAVRGSCRVTLTIRADGSLALPEDLREAMRLDPTGRVSAEVVDGELRLISPRAAFRRAQRIASKYARPGVSVVDELLAERRAEAARG